jgi:hypothetical protein
MPGFVARAPRNDELTFFRSPLNVIASSAKQSSASSQGLGCFFAPRNDGAGGVNHLRVIPLYSRWLLSHTDRLDETTMAGVTGQSLFGLFIHRLHGIRLP